MTIFLLTSLQILRDMFQHKPQITRDQFFSPGFAERKVIMATEILRLVRSRYKPPKSSPKSAFKVMAAHRLGVNSAGAKVEKASYLQVEQEPHGGCGLRG